MLAGDDPAHPIVAFSTALVGTDQFGNSYSAIYLTVEFPRGRTGHPQVQWTGDMTPADAFERLEADMIRVGLGGAAQQVDAEQLLRNLQHAIRDALEGRQALPGAWRTAATLWEALGEEWYVSEAGIEHVSHGLVASPDSLYGPDGWPNKRLDPPSWAEPRWWTFVTDRLRSRLPKREPFDAPF